MTDIERPDDAGRSTGRRRHRLLVSASAMVIVATAPVHAQTAPPATPVQAPGVPGGTPTTDATAADDPGQEIVVTGFRRSIEASLEQQREANAFVNVITAEDVGKFPDRNVADALQRVPGVIISRDGGEGSRVSIRGLQAGLTLTLLNGNFIAGADSGDPQRSFNFVLLPTTFIGTTEVYKSPEARIEEGGVGGTIIVNTRRPLDLPAWSGFASAEGTTSDTTNTVDPQFAGQISWRNDNETLGFLVGATYQERTVRELRGGTETWRWWSDRNAAGQQITPPVDVNGNPFDTVISLWPGQGTRTQDGRRFSGYWAPQAVSAEVFQQQRNRLGIQATAQVKPTDDFTLTANYFRFEYSSNFQSNQLAIPEWGYGNFFTDATFDPSGTIFQSATFQVPAAGTGCLANTPPCTMETPQIRGSYSEEDQVSNTYELEGAYRGDRFDIVFKVGNTRAVGGPSLRFNVAAKPRLTVPGQERNGNFLSRWSIVDNQLNMEFSPEIIQNIQNGAAQIDVGSTGSSFINSSIEQTYAQYDATYRVESFLDSVQFGIKWRDLGIERDTGRIDWIADPATGRRYQETAAGAVARPEFFYDSSIGNIAGGFKANLVPGIDFRSFLNYLNTTYGEGVRVDEDGFQYELGERVWASYIQANFRSDRFRGNIGVRLAETRQTGLTSDRLSFQNDYCTNGPGGPFDPNRPLGPDGNCLVLPLDQRETIVNTSVDQSRTYRDILPSLNAAYDLTDTLLLRGAVAKVIARPSFANLGQQRSLTFNSPAFVFDRAEFGAFPGWSGSGGNLDLKPFSAWQYDVGLEWYFQPGSILGTTLFRKDVRDFIVPLVIDVVQTVQGEPVLIQPYSTNANGSSAVTQGIELFAQHTLPFGLGAQANFTYNDTSTSVITLNGQNVGTSPLVGSAETQVNASIFYENSRLLVRASYNRRGTIVGGLASGLRVYTAPYEQVDLNASYRLIDNLTLSASVINLTKSESRTYLGDDTEARFGSNNYFGRIAFFGLSYNF